MERMAVPILGYLAEGRLLGLGTEREIVGRCGRWKGGGGYKK